MTMKVKVAVPSKPKYVTIQSLKPGTTFRISGGLKATLFLKVDGGNVALCAPFYVTRDDEARKDECAVVVSTTLTED